MDWPYFLRLAQWLIVTSIRLFGTSVWAMRLPSFLAAAGTVALTLSFAWRMTRSRFIAFCAVVLLVFSFGFYGYHAAWTAECDTLWAFFTVGTCSTVGSSATTTTASLEPQRG